MTESISYTRLSTYLRCPFSYMLKYPMGIRPPMNSLPRVWGSALHESIAEHISDQYTEGTSDNLPLRSRFDEILANMLDDYGLGDVTRRLADYIDPLLEVRAELLDKYKHPFSTKAYKENETVKAVAALAAEAQKIAESRDDFDYPVRTPISSRMLLHPQIEKNVLEFIEANPPLLSAGRPLIETDATIETPFGPLRFIIDYITEINGETTIVDWKGMLQDPTPESILTDLQLSFYFTGATAHPNLPDPTQAAIFVLPSGTLLVQEPDPDLIDDLDTSLRALRLAEEAECFPRRRTRDCDYCDYNAYCIGKASRTPTEEV